MVARTQPVNRPGRVLIVDDEATVLELYAQQLERPIREPIRVVLDADASADDLPTVDIPADLLLAGRLGGRPAPIGACDQWGSRQ